MESENMDKQEQHELKEFYRTLTPESQNWVKAKIDKTKQTILNIAKFNPEKKEAELESNREHMQILEEAMRLPKLDRNPNPNRFDFARFDEQSLKVHTK